MSAQVSALAGAVEKLREAADRVAACRALLGDVGLDTLTPRLKALGADATAELRKRRQRLSKEAEAFVAAQVALDASIVEKESIAAEFASLEHTINERKERIDAALSGPRANAIQAAAAVETAQGQLTTAKTNHASANGRLIELRKQRDAEDLVAAETRLREATQQYAAQPVPDRNSKYRRLWFLQ